MCEAPKQYKQAMHHQQNLNEQEWCEQLMTSTLQSLGKIKLLADTVIEGSSVHWTCPTHLLSCGFAVLLNRIRLYFSTQVKLDFSISLALSHVKREEMASTLIECFSQCSSELWDEQCPKDLCLFSPTHTKHTRHRRHTVSSSKLCAWTCFRSANL